MNGPVKHSLSLRGHRTSVSLEDPFWRAFQQAAREESIAINALAAKIDEMREPDIGLASAIRVWLFEREQAKNRL